MLRASFRSVLLALDILDDIAYGSDLLQILSGDLYAKLILQCHYQLEQIQGIHLQILLKLDDRSDLHALQIQLLFDKLFYLVKHHFFSFLVFTLIFKYFDFQSNCLVSYQ